MYLLCSQIHLFILIFQLFPFNLCYYQVLNYIFDMFISTILSLLLPVEFFVLWFIVTLGAYLTWLYRNSETFLTPCRDVKKALQLWFKVDKIMVVRSGNSQGRRWVFGSSKVMIRPGPFCTLARKVYRGEYFLSCEVFVICFAQTKYIFVEPLS